MIARAIRLLLAGGFLAAVAHVGPVAERAAQRLAGTDRIFAQTPRWPPVE
jgi:hypothetical protein